MLAFFFAAARGFFRLRREAVGCGQPGASPQSDDQIERRGRRRQGPAPLRQKVFLHRHLHHGLPRQSRQSRLPRLRVHVVGRCKLFIAWATQLYLLPKPIFLILSEKLSLTNNH